MGGGARVGARYVLETPPVPNFLYMGGLFATFFSLCSELFATFFSMLGAFFWLAPPAKISEGVHVIV